MLLVASLIPFQFFFIFKQYAEGLGNTRIAMIITLSANILNIVLNYLLIYGKAGFPAYGIMGAGYATLIATSSLCPWHLPTSTLNWIFLSRRERTGN
jgi:multidrug resistance protein, MATE family